MAISKLPCLLLLVTAILYAGFAEGGSVRVNYGRNADNLPRPQELLAALSNAGITITSALPNRLLSSAASDQSFADNWGETNIARFYPAIKYDPIAVGNEVFRHPGSLTQFLVPAMRNINAALVRRNLHSAIKISIPISFDTMQYSSPPSAGSFKPDLIEPALKPILDFLRQAGGVDYGACYEPNTLEANAPYAFNSYYQKNSRAPSTWDFGWTAHVVTQPPQFGRCKFPA